MKTITVRVISLTPSIISGVICYSQEEPKKSRVELNFPMGLSLANTSVTKSTLGFGMGIMFSISPSYSLGASVDMFRSTPSRQSIQIPNNLLVLESIHTDLRVTSLSLVNQFELSPQSTINWFVAVKTGLRFATANTVHEGYLLFLKTSDKIYDKESTGLTTEITFGAYVPFSQGSQVGLLIKTGILTMGKIRHADEDSVSYSNSSFIIGRETESNISYWIVTVGVGWQIAKK